MANKQNTQDVTIPEVKFDSGYEAMFNDVDDGTEETVVPEQQNQEPEVQNNVEEDNQNKEPANQEPATNQEPEPPKVKTPREEMEEFLNERDKQKKEEEEKVRLEQERIENEKKLEEEKISKQKEEDEKTSFSDFNFDKSKVLNEEEKNKISDFTKEFPEISDIVDLKLKEMLSEYEEKLKHLDKASRKQTMDSHNKLMQEVLPYVEQQKQVQQATAQENFFSEVEKLHPDFRTPEYEKNFGEWMASLPERQRNIMASELGSGVIDGVSYAFQQFEKDTQYKKAEQQQSQIDNEKKKAEQEAKAKILSRKEAMMGTPTKTSTPVKPTKQQNNYGDDDYANAFLSVKTDD